MGMKWQSGAITEGPSRAPARAMLRASGFDREALSRPIVGVANTWIEIGPCNYHLRELAVQVKQGIRRAGGTPMEFNTVSISDGITILEYLFSGGPAPPDPGPPPAPCGPDPDVIGSARDLGCESYGPCL